MLNNTLGEDSVSSNFLSIIIKPKSSYSFKAYFFGKTTSKIYAILFWVFNFLTHSLAYFFDTNPLTNEVNVIKPSMLSFR